MSREDPQTKLRLPPELKARIEQSAKEHNRSMNADMVARLEKSFEDSGDSDAAQNMRLMYEETKAMLERIEKLHVRTAVEALATGAKAKPGSTLLTGDEK